MLLPFRHEYMAITGDTEFLATARDLTFGFNDATEARQRQRVVSVQSISGTGANHLGAMLIARTFKAKAVWLPDPTWSNHYTIWDHAGVECYPYPYYHETDHVVDLTAMMEVLSTQANKGDAVVFHACAHNPTGTDPTKNQWKQIADLCKQLELAVLFDSAYQGFATGDVDNDAWAIRYFFHHAPELNICVAQSFSKNFGLYGQRVGACHVATSTNLPALSATAESHLAQLIRAEYSMAPRGGCAIVKRVLLDPLLRREWKDNLGEMSSRIRSMRESLYSKFVELQTPGSWGHLLGQVSPYAILLLFVWRSGH